MRKIAISLAVVLLIAAIAATLICLSFGTTFPIFLDNKGNVRSTVWIPFAKVGTFRNGLAPVGTPESVFNFTKWKWGYVDKSCRFIISPKYDSATEFYEGIAKVTLDNQEKWINTKGQVVNELTANMFTRSRWTNDGPRIVQTRGPLLFGAMDMSGKLVIPLKYQFISCISENRYMFQQCFQNNSTKFFDTKCGYLDERGDVLIEPRYEHADDFHWGAAAVSIKTGTSAPERWGLIDGKGNYIIEPKFGFLKVISPDLCSFSEQSREGLQGIMNRKGSVLVQPKFYSIGGFHLGLAKAARNYNSNANLDSSKSPVGDFGYIGTDGTWKIQPQFWRCDDFDDLSKLARAYLPDSDYRRPLSTNFIDLNGKPVFAKWFSSLTDFSEGLTGASLF